MTLEKETRIGAVDLRVAHLAMIQGVIARMSGFSASAKNFCITICAAIIAVAFQKHAPLLNWAAVGVVALFFLMDTYYLSLERRYRDFYEEAASRPLKATPDMSLRTKPLTLRAFGMAMVSVSVLPFYALLMASMAGLLYVANNGLHPAPEASAVRISSSVGPAAKPAQQPVRAASDANSVSSR